MIHRVGQALALAQRGLPVRVLEGAPEFGAIGYGIQFGPNVFHVLDRIGVTEAVLEKADAPPAVLMIDALTGKEVTRVSTGSSFRARFKYPYIIVHRIDLHNVLLEACRRAGKAAAGLRHPHERRERPGGQPRPPRYQAADAEASLARAEDEAIRAFEMVQY